MLDDIKVRRVCITVALPREEEGFHGQVSYGYYTRAGDRLTLTDSAGKPVRRHNGDLVQHTLQAGEDPEAIARVLTRDFRRHLTGSTAFNRRLTYPRGGFI